MFKILSLTIFGLLSVGTGSGLANIDGDENTKRLLECPVCLEVAMPPIYTCQTGHIICSDCKKRLKECVLCKSPYTNSRNFPLESLVQSAKFYCNHRHRGCWVSASMIDLKKHHLKCPMRPMKCHLSTMDKCNGARHYLPDYASHLEKVHNLWRMKITSHFSSPNTLNDIKDDLHESYTWRGGLLEYDGRVFISLIRNRGPVFHFGFFLIGDTSEAAEYKVKIGLGKPTSSSSNKYELRTDVLSIRDFQEGGGKDEPNLPSTAIVHKSFLDSVGESIPVEGTSKFKLRWSTFYEIIKL